MTPDQLREKPNTVRLRSGVQVVNGITGETGPVFSEYVLLSDYEELQRAHAAALEEIERLNAAWKAQQFHLEAEERESAHWQERAEQAERRAERLKGHAEATPETDALFASFFLPGAKTRPTEGDFDEVLKHARTLEQRCNGLAARVRELEEERCCTCLDGALKQPYSTMPPLQTLPWGTEK